MRVEERPQATVAGGLGDEAERAPAQQDRVAAAVGRVARDGDRPVQVDPRADERRERFRRNTRLVSEHDEGRADLRRKSIDPEAQRAREPAARIRIPDAALGSPIDVALDRIGIVPQDHHDVVDPRVGDPIQDVPEHRAAVHRGKQLAAPEPRPGTGREDDGGDRWRGRSWHASMLPGLRRGSTVAARDAPQTRRRAMREGTSMTEPTASPQDSLPSEADEAADGGDPPATAAPPPPAFAAFDPASRIVIIGSAVMLVVAVIGLIIGAWQLNPFGFILIIAAVIAAGTAWIGETMTVPDAAESTFPVGQLASGAVATSLSLLAVVEMIGDLDDMEDYGGPLGLLLGIVILGASTVVLWGAMRRTAPDLRGAERGAMLAAVGAGLVLLAWVLHLTIGFWALGPASWGLAAIIVAAVLLLVAPDVRLPSWIGWVAVALALFAGWTAFGQWGALMDVGEDQVVLGLEDYLPFLVYIAGILLVLGGAVMTAIQATPAASAALAGVLRSDPKDAAVADAGAEGPDVEAPVVEGPTADSETPTAAAPPVDIATALSAEPPATDPHAMAPSSVASSALDPDPDRPGSSGAA